MSVIMEQYGMLVLRTPTNGAVRQQNPQERIVDTCAGCGVTLDIEFGDEDRENYNGIFQYFPPQNIPPHMPIPGPCYIPTIIYRSTRHSSVGNWRYRGYKSRRMVTFGLWCEVYSVRRYVHLTDITRQNTMRYTPDEHCRQTVKRAGTLFEHRLLNPEFADWQNTLVSYMIYHHTWPALSAHITAEAQNRLRRHLRNSTSGDSEYVKNQVHMPPHDWAWCDTCYPVAQHAIARDFLTAAVAVADAHGWAKRSHTRRKAVRYTVALLACAARVPYVILDDSMYLPTPKVLEDLEPKDVSRIPPDVRHLMGRYRLPIGPTQLLDSVTHAIVEDPDGIIADHMDARTSEMVMTFVDWRSMIIY